MANSDERVTVTGATGFIALHCIQQLLQEGYRVRGTMRSLKKERAVRDALGLDEEALGRLELVEANLDDDAGWPAAVEGATYVLHVASPLPAAPPKNVDDLVRPARDGTLRVLRAARDAGVKRIVVTSSVAAIMGGHSEYGGRVFTEDDWTNLDGNVPPYDISKTKAERAAWEFMETEAKDSALELVTVNPAFVLGPSLLGVDNTSNETIAKLVRREFPGCPRLRLGIVDVRDCARGHILAMTTPEAAGKRIILSGDEAWYAEIAKILKDAGYRVPTLTLPDWLVRIAALFDKTVQLVMPILGQDIRLSNERARSLLGWSYRPMRETIVETAEGVQARS